VGLRPKLTIALAALLLAGVTVALLGRGGTFAAFSGQASNGSAGLAADTDWTPPNASAAVVAKGTGGDAGYIRAGGTYYSYANVTDGGNPGSGVASVSADAGLGAIALNSAGGPWTVDGVSYNYRSAVQTLAAGTAAGTYPLAVSSTDSDTPANSQTQNGFSVVVDNTGASATDVQTANGGSIAGRPEQGDTVTFIYSEPIERLSILPGWTGATANVVVRINQANPRDRLQVYDAADAILLPLTNGAGLDLGRNDYVTANRTFGATGTPSTMVRSGNSITITLGTQSGAGTTAGNNSTMSWTPSASATDRAGNATSTTAGNETGAADREF
jgi:hypothetical protein